MLIIAILSCLAIAFGIVMSKLSSATRSLPTDITKILQDHNKKLKEMNDDFEQFLNENRKNLPK